MRCQNGHVTIDPIERTLRPKSISWRLKKTLQFLLVRLFLSDSFGSIYPLYQGLSVINLHNFPNNFSVLREVHLRVRIPRNQASFIVLRRRENRYPTLILAQRSRKGHLIISSLPTCQLLRTDEQLKNVCRYIFAGRSKVTPFFHIYKITYVFLISISNVKEGGC